MSRPSPASKRGALFLYAVATVLSFPHALPGGGSMDLGLLMVWLGPAALIVGLAEETPRRAMTLAFVASLAGHAVLFHWFIVVTVVYGGMPAWLGFLAPLLPALYVSIFTALFAWLFVRIARDTRHAILIGACLWVAVDWARGHFLGGFPWATLGYALHLDWPLLGWTRWAGVYALSFFAAAVGIALGRVWLDRSPSVRRDLAVVVFLLAVAHGLGAWISSERTDRDRTVRVAAIQGNIDQGEKWHQARRDRIFSGYLRLSREAAEAGARWILWPETAVPGLLETEPEFANRIGLLARAYDVSFIVGGTGVDFDPVERRYTGFYDSAFLLDEVGQLRDRYDKSHLVPFGEFVPLRAFFGRFFKSLARGLSSTDITAGEGPRTFSVDLGRPMTDADAGSRAAGQAIRVGVPICYELIFPDLVRRFGRDGASVMLAMTNDAWYGRTGAPHQFLAMTALRAAENGRAIVRAANTGVSAIIDSRGRVQSSTPLFEEAVLIGEVPLAIDVAPTLYARIGDVFAWICVAVSLVLLGRRGWQERTSRKSRENPTTGDRREQIA